VSVTFRPTSAGVTTALVNVNVAAPATSQSVTLSGTPLTPSLGLSPTTLAFGSVTRGTPSAPQAITVSNTGAAAMTITSIVLTGANPAQFSQSNICGPFPATVAVGASCTVNVTFAPTNGGAKSASLRVNVATPAVSAGVALSGTGL
jgi:hypothetical protein